MVRGSGCGTALVAFEIEKRKSSHSDLITEALLMCIQLSFHAYSTIKESGDKNSLFL